jgi:LuxR family maltose regulon positive regulatory protein
VSHSTFEGNLATPLLRTKLYIPPVRPKRVSRPRLVARLTQGLRLGSKLTLISAPAGFGKTTLLSEWIHTLGAHRPFLDAGDPPRGREICVDAPVQVAWVSLDKGDNDLARFLTYLVAAIQTVEPRLSDDVVAMTQSPQPPDAELVLTALSNDLADCPIPIVLALDDYHEITAEPVHDALVFLLDHLPPHVHLVIATRIDPPWPLARMRSRQEVTELRTRDLRFTLDQVAAFMNDVMGLELSAEDVATLDTRTEGWIAGLQMAALSMQGGDTTRAAAFIQAFSGSHRFVLDYLVEEVLDRQDNEIQAFLLKTSILSRLTGPLCDAVLAGKDCEASRPQSDSQTILVLLERANLFLVPLDDERRWFRYHHLFADLLRSRLQKARPAQTLALHHRASEWYEQNGYLAEAVSHALEAQDWRRVAHLAAQSALTLIYHGELLGLARSLSALPQTVWRAHPWLPVAYAWAMAYAGQLDEIGPALKQANDALTSLQNADEVRQVSGHIAAIRAYAADLKGELSSSVAFARQALEYLAEEAVAVRGFTLSLLGTALRDSGDLDAAEAASSEAIAVSRTVGDSRVTVTALCELAILHIWRGALHKAAAACREAIEIGQAFVRQRGHPLPVTALAHARLALVHLECHELEDALRCAREAVRLCEPWGQADVSITAYSRLSSVLAMIGDIEGAHEAFDRARQVAEGVSPWYSALLASRKASMRLTEGDLDAAARWARESGLRYDDAFATDGEAQYSTLARVLVAQGKLDEALILLDRLLEQAKAARAVPQILGALTLRAPILYARGRQEEALAALERALVLAEPEGYVRPFVSGGAPMRELLKEAAARGIVPEYVARLLTTMNQDTKAPRPATVRAPRPSLSALPPLVEPLSDRELEVLRLLPTDLSSPEMAQHLYISRNTVRTHIAHIYAKLGVHSREEAVQRAEELGLL